MATKLLMGLYFALAVLVVFLEGIHSSQRLGEKQGLTITEANKNKVSGTYQGSRAHIHFSSKADDQGSSVSVTSASGAPIFSLTKPQDSSVLTMGMGDKKFVTKMNEPKSGVPRYSDYVVPQVLHSLVQFASTQGVPSDLLQLVESASRGHDVNSTRRRAMEDLIGQGQADAIVEAAKAMGNAGVMGYDNPAALQFYALAMRLEGAKEKLKAQAAEAYYAQNLLHYLTSRAKRHATDRIMGNGRLLTEVLAESAECPECITGSCPFMGDQSNGCNGMCGQACTCWWWVCGDCCVQQGCLEHDECCARDGYFSSACLNMFYFTCKSYSC